MRKALTASVVLAAVVVLAAGCSQTTGGTAIPNARAVTLTSGLAAGGVATNQSTVTLTVTSPLSDQAPEIVEGPGASSKPGDTSQSKTVTSAEILWPIEPDQVGVSPSPEFPSVLNQWRLESAWSTQPRAFTGDWAEASGPDFSDFPATMNGCDSNRHLVRWRAVNPGALVEAGFANTVDLEPVNSVTANAGWMDIDGCYRPVFMLVDGNGSDLTDIAVDVQHWVPAPGGPNSAPVSPSPVSTDLSGEVYGFISSVDVENSRLTMDKVDWFTGAAAVQACAEDGETGGYDNWCTGYYFRNVNPKTRVISVAAAAAITTLGTKAQSVSNDLLGLKQRLLSVPGAASNLYRMEISGGAIVTIGEVYHP